MTDQHPIAPPPELVEQWRDSWHRAHGVFDVYITTQAANWGADQELEACCEWAAQFNYDDYRYQDELRATRRPKPPGLKVRIAEAIAKGNKHDALSLLDEALPDD